MWHCMVMGFKCQYYNCFSELCIPYNKKLSILKWEAFADENLCMVQAMVFVQLRGNSLQEKEKMLVTSIFCCSDDVF